MRTSERDFLLILLAIASGSADAWSYMGLGRTFVANMTGNTVLIGLSFFTGHDLAPRLITLTCYVPGVALAAWLTRGVPESILWSRAVSWTLLLEALLLIAGATAWAALQLPVSVLLGCVAFAIGLQSGAMLQLRIPGIVTTYITGTWTTLVSGLATFNTRERGKPQSERSRFEERLAIQAAIILVYFVAAVLTGWLSLHARRATGVLPSVSVLIAAVYGLARQVR